MSASVTTDSGEVQTTGSGVAGPHGGSQTSGSGRAGRERDVWGNFGVDVTEAIMSLPDTVPYYMDTT